ncbi:redoxin domain-containing protein [Diaminobutyricibacter tongyongensis]|uniref:Redoxin domain-containing protein n=1 Tax=Leifsonia tongyongensis TaxID=1268043 RepID=A0A6L9XUE2_9MICO|nr:redoxin domain-containing protein [Diaminobutyricibacter tongyongensis]NEN04694.1 redoxin domain-containing protein [Diaminobutyricibacter tongyongensis]
MTKTAATPGARTWIFWLATGIGIVVTFALVVIAATSQGASSAGAADTAAGISPGSAKLIQLDKLSGKPQRAPDFDLTDQHGNHINLASFAGRSVVLTFNDDQCQDLCTLLAQDVVTANRDLGSGAKNVAFVSINANPYYPTVSSVAAWTNQHDLGGAANWYFGTAAPSQLAAVAERYGVPIEQDAAAKSVVHGTEIFFIDPSGHESALGQFGTDSASTGAFGNALAQMAVDLLPAAQQGTVGGRAAADAPSGSAGIGSHPKSFVLPSLTGGLRFGDPAAPGRYTVLNFWASSCSACATELPALQKVYTQLGDHVRFLGIDVSDKPAVGRAAVKAEHVSYPIASDANGAVAGRFQITGLPFTVILDSHGTVVIRHPGALTAEQLEYILQSLTSDH